MLPVERDSDSNPNEAVRFTGWERALSQIRQYSLSKKDNYLTVLMEILNEIRENSSFGTTKGSEPNDLAFVALSLAAPLGVQGRREGKGREGRTGREEGRRKVSRERYGGIRDRIKNQGRQD